MMTLLEFVFRDLWTFVGCICLIVVASTALAEITRAIRG